MGIEGVETLGIMPQGKLKVRGKEMADLRVLRTGDQN